MKRMKRLVALFLSVAMITASLVVPVSVSANQAVTFRVLPVGNTMLNRAAGTAIDMEVRLEAPAGQSVGSISYLHVDFNPAILRWRTMPAGSYNRNNSATWPFAVGPVASLPASNERLSINAPEHVNNGGIGNPALGTFFSFDAQEDNVAPNGRLMILHFELVAPQASGALTPVQVRFRAPNTPGDRGGAGVNSFAGVPLPASNMIDGNAGGTATMVNVTGTSCPLTGGDYPNRGNGYAVGSQRVDIRPGDRPRENFTHWTVSSFGSITILPNVNTANAHFIMPANPAAATITAHWAGTPSNPVNLVDAEIRGVAGPFKQGWNVTVDANIPSGHVITGWTVSGIPAVSGTPTSHSFVMPNGPVSITVNHMPRPWVPERQTIEVEIPWSEVPSGAAYLQMVVDVPGVTHVVPRRGASDGGLSAFNSVPQDHRFFNMVWDINTDHTGSDFKGVTPNFTTTVSGIGGAVPAMHTSLPGTLSGDGGPVAYSTHFGEVAYFLIPGGTWWADTVTPQVIAAVAGLSTRPTSGNLTFSIPQFLITQHMIDNGAHMSITFYTNGTLAGSSASYTMSDTYRFTIIAPPPVQTYPVTINGVPMANEFAAGQLVTITAPAAPGGQMFRNWVAPAGVSLANANAGTTTFQMPAHAVALTVEWQPITQSHPIIVVANGGVGTGTNPSGSANAGLEVTLIPGTRAGHLFAGWSSVGVSFGAFAREFEMPNNPVTITANWLPIATGGVVPSPIPQPITLTIPVSAIPVNTNHLSLDIGPLDSFVAGTVCFTRANFTATVSAPGGFTPAIQTSRVSNNNLHFAWTAAGPTPGPADPAGRSSSIGIGLTTATEAWVERPPHGWLFGAAPLTATPSTGDVVITLPAVLVNCADAVIYVTPMSGTFSGSTGPTLEIRLVQGMPRPVSIIDGGSGATGDGLFEAGDLVYVFAGVRPGFVFSHWSGTGDLGSSFTWDRRSDSFVMPGSAVNLRAHWTSLGGSINRGRVTNLGIGTPDATDATMLQRFLLATDKFAFVAANPTFEWNAANVNPLGASGMNNVTTFDLTLLKHQIGRAHV